jgi:hypothetical protein
MKVLIIAADFASKNTARAIRASAKMYQPMFEFFPGRGMSLRQEYHKKRDVVCRIMPNRILA